MISIKPFKPFKMVKSGENQSIQIDLSQTNLSNSKSSTAASISAATVKAEIETNNKSKKTKEK